MWDVLLWLYMTNATLLLVHEMDSAYWHEWELFRLPGGIAGFLVIHLPLVMVVFWGLVRLDRRSPAGLLMTLVLAAAGIFAFGVHMYFIRKGRPEFRTPVSIGILAAALAASLSSGGLALFLFAV